MSKKTVILYVALGLLTVAGTAALTILSQQLWQRETPQEKPL